MAIDQTRADRLARTLKRLGFSMSRTGRRFVIFDGNGQIAPGATTGMDLSAVESWLKEFVKPKKPA